MHFGWPVGMRGLSPPRLGGTRAALGGGNVVTVSHNRVDPRLRVDECAVVVEAEVRGPEHAAEVLSGLRVAGFTVSVE